jgi:hypothetical protein
MKVTNWLTHIGDTDLQNAAEEKIRKIKVIENDIPGVVIIDGSCDKCKVAFLRLFILNHCFVVNTG